ncbi:peptidyl-tRNA hydrolase, PTH1 family, partial [Phenoliferia sp. Uapishka_3]
MSAPRLFVIVGLGNYTHPSTRHSVGQILLSSLAYKASQEHLSTGSPTLLLNAKKAAWTSQITLPAPPQSTSDVPLKLLFVKPRALMNVSGPSVVSSIQSFLPQPYSTYRILTLQDDLDLPASAIKIQRGGSPRGHNGVRSLERSLGTRDFWRIRIGIGRPENKADVARWVLSALGRDEVRAVECEDGWEGGAASRAWAEVLKIAWAEAE